MKDISFEYRIQMSNSSMILRIFSLIFIFILIIDNVHSVSSMFKQIILNQT
jgi:hypothetical protein